MAVKELTLDEMKAVELGILKNSTAYARKTVLNIPSHTERCLVQ